MVKTMSEKIVVGVWKDKLTYNESRKLAEELVSKCAGLNMSNFTASIAAAPYAAITIREIFEKSLLTVTYQDVHWPCNTGTYMGSSPIRLLLEQGIQTCMVGHSERRRFFGESAKDRYLKLGALIDAGITPILCIGDDVTNWEERSEILRTQLSGDLGVDTDRPIDLSKIIIAYEPVWAISTWRSDQPLPTGEEVGKMLELVREIAHRVTNMDISSTSFLFGGSVSPANAEEYFSVQSVDGALVGGASLKAESMYEVYKAASEAWSA